MLKPKPSTRIQRYWDRVADDDLVEIDLITNDPEALDGLVHELPENSDEEPYVEFKYDLRGTDREKLRCVHGNHPHLAGFVMRQGSHRFLVGHICGEHIYGENFQQYAADFDAAVNRQDALRRVKELRAPVSDLIIWIAHLRQSDIFREYTRIKRKFETLMPWIYDNLHVIADDAEKEGVNFPPKDLFRGCADPCNDLERIIQELNTAIIILRDGSEQAAAELPKLKPRLDTLIKRIDRMFVNLERPLQLFQADIISFIAKNATDYDNPRKRVYEAGIFSITCRSTGNRNRVAVIKLPSNYVFPERRPLERLRALLPLI